MPQLSKHLGKAPDQRIAKRRTIGRSLMACAGPLAMMLGVSGCAQPKGLIFSPFDPPVVWPSPPESPRIRYAGELRTDSDLKPARSGFEVMGSAIFGKKPSNSMLTPFAVCTDNQDRVFVCDTNAQVVHVFDLMDRSYEQWKPGDGWSAFGQPTGIASDSLNQIFVADSVAGVVFQFDDQGVVIAEIGSGILSRPVGLAFDQSREALFVADAAAHRIFMFSATGELLQVIGERGDQQGDFNYPTNVAIDSRGMLYVSDSLNFRIQVFDRDLAFLRQIGSEGDLPGYFSQPKGIALDSEDHLYVVDARFELVQLFDSNGALLMSFGEEGHGPGQFWLPAGIHIDSADRIWIADPYNRRVQMFEYLTETVESSP